jgi:hypothetical protein
MLGSSAATANEAKKGSGRDEIYRCPEECILNSGQHSAGGTTARRSITDNMEQD